jgi:hypothetical protein
MKGAGARISELEELLTCLSSLEASCKRLSATLDELIERAIRPVQSSTSFHLGYLGNKGPISGVATRWSPTLDTWLASPIPSEAQSRF